MSANVTPRQSTMSVSPAETAAHIGGPSSSITDSEPSPVYKFESLAHSDGGPGLEAIDKVETIKPRVRTGVDFDDYFVCVFSFFDVRFGIFWNILTDRYVK